MDKSTSEAPKRFKQLYSLSTNPATIYLFEQQIYDVALELTKLDSEPCSSGYWKSKALPDGGFVYTLDSKRTFSVFNEMNGAEVKEVNARVLSASAFLIALSQFSIYLYKQANDEELKNAIDLLHEKVYGSRAGLRRKKDISDFLKIID